MPTEKSTSPKKDVWAFTPPLPLATSPYLRFPSSVVMWLGWLVRSWLPLTERLIFFGLAWASWVWLTPHLAAGAGFDINWVALVWLKNICLMSVIAGGLHLYLYRWGKQGKARKFDRSMANKDAARFTFKNQVYDNMFWTLISGVTVWTAFEALLLWAQANDIGWWLSFTENPVLFIGLFIVIPSWNSFWFFCIHRALHWPPLYRIAHHVHHRNVSVGPWSGNAMHPLEHLMWLAGALVYIPVMCHPVHFIFSQQLSILGAVTSHSGYEGLEIGGKRVLRLGDFFHQLHHRFYECNYGTAEVGIDRLHNSFHDGQTAPPSLRKFSRKTG